ncbi:mitochondrial SMC_prok domain-containing protein [Andalucia godoyi]|uniref:Mitochondrial SMC_prok domain-containing protein n=1 Tax=Andalucia godoyi TaxID=505711 RepID=A0A8K0F0G2_ANDGO|nr:mitochondrial SMC_prok domain-containing protein [Andalucia godoyi]|eukprot:ANDGO_01779.mRNA.1 mitochondrial SMC_prok domain-containing protein
MSRVSTVRALKQYHGSQARLQGTIVDYEALRNTVSAANQKASETMERLQNFSSFVKDRKTKIAEDSRKTHWLAVDKRLREEIAVLDADLEEFCRDRNYAIASLSLPSVHDVYTAYSSDNRNVLISEIRRLNQLIRAYEKSSEELSTMRTADATSNGGFSEKTIGTWELEDLGWDFSDHDVPWILADVYDVSTTVRIEYEKMIADCHRSYQRELDEAAQKRMACPPNWTEGQKYRFWSVLKEFEDKPTASRKSIRERLLLEFSGNDQKSVADIDVFWEYVTASKFCSQKVQVAEKSLVLELVKVRKTISTMITELADHFDREAELRITEEQADEARERYDQVSADMRAKRDLAKYIEDRKRRELETEKQKEWERFQEHRQELKILVDQYRKSKLEIEAAKKEMENAEREIALEESAQLRLKNTDRVKYRISKLREKQEERKRKLALYETEQKERESRLEALKALVKVEVQADPGRAIGPTEATSNKRDVTIDERAAFFSDHGYSDATLFRDPRFKLQAALSDAGLLSTAYARHVMATTKPSSAYRNDMKTTLKFS